MNATVDISRRVKVHTHRFTVHVQSSRDAPAVVSLTCGCGNGWRVDTVTNGVANDQTVLLSDLLEMAADEQDRRHKDWA